MSRDFSSGDSLEVAPQLLGKLLVRADGRAGRIIEVEAYRGQDDPASHAYRGPTRRTATMWGPPAHLYVYFTYGMHWCANVVCGPEGVAAAVLLRALEPVSGLEQMRTARWPDAFAPAVAGSGGAVGTAVLPSGASAAAASGSVEGIRRPRAASGRGADRDLCRGPARLCQALGIDGSFDGADLATASDGVWLADDGVAPPDAPAVTSRTGISVATDVLWRWAYPDHPGVSPWRAGRSASSRLVP